MTLHDFVNANPYTMVFVTGIGYPTGTTQPAGQPGMDWVDEIGILDLDGCVDGEGAWQWNGKGDPRDERGNSILKVTAYVSKSQWESAVADWEATV